MNADGTFRSKIFDWFDARFHINDLIELIAKKSVPIHRHSLWYYFGGMTLFLFVVQVSTGILLLLYYRPTAEAAFESVQFIMTKVRFGWLVRSIHSWSANLMVAAAFVHMFSVFLMKAYRKPRELTWVTGILLFFLTLGFGFSGYLLPWNELSFFATKVGTEIFNELPLIGRPMLIFLRGGEEVTGATLTRFFGFHVAVLPLLLNALLVVHLFMVQRQGMSSPPSVEMESTEELPAIPFVPNFLLRDMLGWVLAVGLLAALAALFPWELGVKADPFAPAPAGIKPEWYFLFAFETLKLVPAQILFLEGEMVAILFFGLCGILWLLVPFLDRWSAAGRRSSVFTTIGVVAIAYIVIMTVMAYLVSPV